MRNLICFGLYVQNLGVAADMTSYNILLKCCCHASRVDLAQEIYREVQRLESTGVLKLDVFTYSTIVKVLSLSCILLQSQKELYASTILHS